MAVGLSSIHPTVMQSAESRKSIAIEVTLKQAREAYMRGDSVTASALIEAAIVSAHANGDAFGEASALALDTTFAHRDLNFEKAAARGEEALVIAAQSSNFRASAEACIALSSIYSGMGMIDEGMRMAEDARAFAETANDLRLLAFAHLRIAHAHLTRETVYGVPCTHAELAHFRAARKIAMQSGALDAKTAALHNCMASYARRAEHPLDNTRLVSRRRLRLAGMLADLVMDITAPEENKALREFVELNCAVVWCMTGRVEAGLKIFESIQDPSSVSGGADSFEALYGMAQFSAGLHRAGASRLEKALEEPMPIGTFFRSRIRVRNLLVTYALKQNRHEDACRHLLAAERERRVEFNHQSTMRQAVDTRLRALRAASQEADTDPLTQLLNRRGFPEKVSIAFKRARNQNRALSLAMIDVDHFKEVNDQLGHLIGDKVLRYVAQVLKKHAARNDLIGRYGGDEFVIVAPDTKIDELIARCERVRAELSAAAPEAIGAISTITVSVGVSALTDSSDITSLLHEADMQLYRAKRDGRNCVRG